MSMEDFPNENFWSFVTKALESNLGLVTSALQVKSLTRLAIRPEKSETQDEAIINL